MRPGCLMWQSMGRVFVFNIATKTDMSFNQFDTLVRDRFAETLNVSPFLVETLILWRKLPKERIK